MSAIFEGYEQEFSARTATASSKIGQLKSSTGSSRQSTRAKASSDLDEAEELLQQMDLECRSVAAAERGRLQTRLKGHKSELSALRRELKEAALAAPRRELLGDLGDRSDGEMGSERARFLANNDRMERGTNKLKEAQRVVTETEQVGASIMEDLRGQRETIMHASGAAHSKNCSATLRGPFAGCGRR